MKNSAIWLVLIGLLITMEPISAQRVADGVIALYEFNEGSGNVVRDSSGFDEPLDLFIDDDDLADGLIEWGAGFISINRGTNELKEDGTRAPIESDGPATKIYDAIVNPDNNPTDAFTVEAWVVPERDGSPGLELDSNPARMVSMSQDHSFRNFTLGQQDPGDLWVSRVRNSEAGRNGTCCGIGQMESDFGAVEAEVLTHVVLTRDAEGTETLYYNKAGEAFGDFVTRDVPGTLIDGGGGTDAGGNPGATDWSPDYGLALGDETNVAQRKWVGDFHLVAIYNQALTFDGVQQNFLAGPDAGAAPLLQAGDADQDLDFDQLDLVKVQIAAKYLTGQAATWGDGDWDGAPGGKQGEPPAGNGTFDQLDIVSALGSGIYLKGPYAAIPQRGALGDGQASLVYQASSGELSVDPPAGHELTSINITSDGAKFVGDKPPVLDGAFDNFDSGNLFKATFGGSFGTISFGVVLPPNLSESAVRADLSAIGSLAGGGDLGAVDLVYIPEPSSIALLLIAMLLTVARTSSSWSRERSRMSR